MNLLDFILNVAGVLLWLNWCSVRLDPLVHATPATLVGTIRATKPNRLKRWDLLVYLALLILLRAFLYHRIGPAVDWTPKLNLGAIALAFRSNNPAQQLLFSIFSLLRALLVAYFWLLMIAAVNRRTNDPGALQKLLTLQLGKAAHWPWWLQLLVPVLTGSLLWLACYPILAHWEIINTVASKWHVAGQSIIVGLGLLPSVRYVLPIFLLLHLIVSYVYLGNSPLWEFISETSRNILKPLNRLGLRFGKVDFAPIVGLLLVILVFFYPLPAFVNYFLETNQLTLWPW